MKKVFKVEGIESIKQIACEDLRNLAAEGYDASIYDSIAEAMNVNDDVIDDTLELDTEEANTNYNKWFDEGALDQAAFLIIYDHVSNGHEDYKAPIKIYRDGKIVTVIDQEEIEDILD